MNALPIAHCIANIDSIIENAAMAGKIELGPVARWQTGETIYIRGKWRSKSAMFPRWCIRWQTGDQKSGMFAKGLAGYSGPQLPIENLDHLPLAK